MGNMEEARDAQRRDYERVLGEVKVEATGERLSETQAGNYLSTGFAQGFMEGYKVSAGAAHAALSVVIGELDAGLIDVEGAKAKLIPLREIIREDAGL